MKYLKFIAALLAMACWVISPGLLSADELAEAQARFGQVNGNVQILSSGASDWVDAHVDLPIERGDQIHVGDDGEAELAMSENVLWVLHPNTDVIVEHAVKDEGQLTITQGGLLGKVDASAGPQRWEFSTPMAVCA